jgi:hypothetical protein
LGTKEKRVDREWLQCPLSYVGLPSHSQLVQTEVSQLSCPKVVSTEVSH